MIYKAILLLNRISCFSVFFYISVSEGNQNLMLQGLLGTQISSPTCTTLSTRWTPSYSSNLVGYWKLDGTIGSISNNSTISATVGTSGTSTSSGSLTYANSVASGLNQCINFNSSNTADYLNMGSSTSITDLGPATWMAWIKPNSTSAAGTIFYSSDNNSSRGWFIYLDYSSGVRINFKAVHSSTNIQLKSSGTISSGSWGHVVVTWDGSSGGCTNTPSYLCTGVHIYVNGVETSYQFAQAPSGTHDTGTAYPLYIGRDPSGAGGALKDTDIDELAIWNRVLTPTEISILYRYQKCN